MSIFSDILSGVRTTFIGLKVTVPYIWRKPVTVEYPHQRIELPDRTRNRLYVNMDDCIGCDQCARVCPVNCITIETAKAVGEDNPGVTSNGKKKALWVTRFDIDIAKCCFCNLCTYPCPTECIEMTDVFEFSEFERNNLIYSYITLTPEEIVEKLDKAATMEAEMAAKKAAAKSAEPGPSTATTPKPAPTPSVAVTGDPDKAAKLAELQAKMAAAKAAKEGAPAAAPAPPIPPAVAADPDKAARLAELQRKIAEAKAKKEQSG